MAPQKPTPKKQNPGKQPPQYRSHPPRPPAGAPEVVDPIWLLKAVALVIIAALVCGYGSLCLLLYQGQWQLILHPKQTSTVPAAIAGTPIELIHFGTDESGTPQLTGWSIPAAKDAHYASLTILFLPPGNGSLIDTLPTLTVLHNLGINIFAIDYRGYGLSAAVHPNQARMTQDADTALHYLMTSRAVPGGQIIPYGTGVAASLAAHLAASQTAIPAVILDTPDPDPLQIILHDPRTKFLPVNALIHDRFPLTEPLGTLKTPKLLIQPEKDDSAFKSAADPRITIFEMPKPGTPDYAPTLTRYLARFLDQYATAAVQQLQSPPK
ncbi:alpha/beta hydrolase family protein [Granulicella arctica]|uniref:alpha/beta hydrolase n=1 Tax=Granulicella arctica TaxID=940613 RepID=UPI0021DFE2C5|nr:alpha/beta hydrolase [Granulicella arctica]